MGYGQVSSTFLKFFFFFLNSFPSFELGNNRERNLIWHSYFSCFDVRPQFFHFNQTYQGIPKVEEVAL